jgi:hypothetical protein
VREVEHRVQQLIAGQVAAHGRKAKPAKAKPQADIATLERELSEVAGHARQRAARPRRQGPAGDPLTPTWMRWTACWNACAARPNDRARRVRAVMSASTAGR